MKIHFDDEADVLYLRIDASTIVESEEVKPGVVLDFDAAGQVVGVEIRSLRARTSATNLRPFQLELS
jgi:uncharacterized protein YuzE